MLPLRENEKLAIGASGGSEFLSWEGGGLGAGICSAPSLHLSQCFWFLTIVTRGFVTTQLSP